MTSGAPRFRALRDFLYISPVSSNECFLNCIQNHCIMKSFNTTFSIFSLFLLLSCGQLFAQHTFSIVAVDPVTGEVGSAGATCLTSADCGGCGGAVIISQLTPGLGAINAQATVCIPNFNAINGNSQIAAGQDAPTVLNSLLTFDGCQFGDTADRQYGIVTLDSNAMPASVSFTGSGALSFAGHRTGPTYAVQGNILLGPQIIDSMEARFNATNGPLCEKLMAALQGANVPGADSRCLPDSISSESSFIRVAQPGDGAQLWLDLRVGATLPGVDPIDSLQVLFDQFKAANSISDPAQPSIRAYPNPAEDAFRIDFKAHGTVTSQVSIFNAAGQQVYSGTRLPNQSFIDVDARDLGAAGIYLIHVEDLETGGRSTVKMVVR